MCVMCSDDAWSCVVAYKSLSHNSANVGIYRDVDAVEENLKKIVLEKTECANQPKKTNAPQIG